MKTNTQIINNQPITIKCPMCNSDKVQPLGMDIGFTFRANELSVTMPTIAHVCNKCGYLMLFIKRSRDSEGQVNWD